MENTIRIGDRYRRYGKDLIHVRGFVDDHVVFCRWLRRKRYWSYEAVPVYLFDQEHRFFIPDKRKRDPKVFLDFGD